MPHECMSADAEFAESWFDGRPIKRIPAAHLAHTTWPCSICRSPICALSDYGFFDFGYLDDDDEPEWAALCWGCAKPILCGEAEAA